MNQLIDKILTEWAYRVDDGMPNPANEVHMIHLEESLNELNLPKPVVKKVLEKVRTYVDNSMNRKLKRVGKPWGSKGGTTSSTDSPTEKPSDDTPTEKPSIDSEASEAEQIRKKLTGDMSWEERVTNLEVLAELELEGKQEEKQLKELEELRESINRLPEDDRDAMALLVAKAYLYTQRKNTGYGKNAFGYIDIQQLVLNREKLLKMYDDAIPEEVEKGVRGVRNKKVSDDYVNESYDTLPPHLKKALKGKGKVAGKNAKNHFLGYKATNPETGEEYISYDHTDKNIRRDENGKPEVLRGGLPSEHRARLMWRMYLEQGGKCAYTGQPLKLEEMDLEHVVGFENKDTCTPEQVKAKTCPTEEDYKNREHERNQVLTASNANQRKKDMNMKQFVETQVDPLKDKPEEDFERMEKGYDKANKQSSKTEITVLRLMDEKQYRIKGGETTTDPNHPDIRRSDTGQPKVVDANISESQTPESIEKEFEIDDQEFEEIQDTLLEQVDDKKERTTIKQMISKIGKRSVQAMGLATNVTDASRRRTNSVFTNDDGYRGLIISMAGKSTEEQQIYKKEWSEARRIATRDEILDHKPSSEVKEIQRRIIIKHMRDKGLISDEVLNHPKYGKWWRYKNDKGEVV